ncbi:MAG: hypothetical protein ABI674_09875 [Spartobacteria bacterium]
MISSIAQFVVAAAMVVFAGTFLTRATDTIAEATGWGRLLVGGFFLAGATSRRELSVDINAVRQGMPNLAVGDLMGSSLFNLLILAVLDLALGNIFGSNSFNMLLLVPLDLVQPGPLLTIVSATHAFTALATVLITAVAVMGQLYHMERRRFLIEPDAALIVILVLGALTTVYWLH